MLLDPSSAVRVDGLLTLSHTGHGDDRLVDALTRMVECDPGDAIRIEAARALEKFGRRSDISTLVGISRRQHSRPVKRAIAVTVSRLAVREGVAVGE